MKLKQNTKELIDAIAGTIFLVMAVYTFAMLFYVIG